MMMNYFNPLRVLLLFLFLSSCAASRFERVSIYVGAEREYSVYVKDFADDLAIWEEMREYGQDKEDIHGPCTVWFFSNRRNTPDITFTGSEFSDKYNRDCVGMYFNGKVMKYPFRR